MRNAFPLVLALLLAFLSTAPDAHARRRGKPKAAANDGPFSIAVAPFDGERAGGRTLSEIMELELELIETVLVKGDRWLRSDLRRAGDAGYEPAALRRIMKKRKIDILVRGRRAGDGIEVLVFGRDGKPRFLESFPLPDDPDASARAIVEKMKPVLLRWPRAKVIDAAESDAPVVVRRQKEPEPEPTPTVDEDDLFLDFEDGDEEEASSPRATRLADPDPMPAGDDEGRARRVQDDPPATETRAADPPREEGNGRRRLLLDDDDEEDSGAARRRSLLSGDDDFSRRPEVTMADVESGAGDAAPLLHWIAVSAGGAGGGWYYEFAAAKDVEDDMARMFTSYGGGARVSVWPIEYVGVDAFATVTTFHVKADGLPVRPTELDVVGISAGASARARYPFKLGSLAFAPGARAGYRYWGSNVEPQTNTVDDRAFTLVPGWQMHALAVGVELYAAYVVEKWRFEAELHAEPLPFVRYEETPDNPAAFARPLGGAAGLILRIPIYAPVYVELNGNTTALLVTWEGGPGTRLSQTRTDGSGNRLRVDGGETLNVQFGGGLAVGASF